MVLYRYVVGSVYDRCNSAFRVTGARRTLNCYEWGFENTASKVACIVNPVSCAPRREGRGVYVGMIRAEFRVSMGNDGTNVNLEVIRHGVRRVGRAPPVRVWEAGWILNGDTQKKDVDIC